MHDQEWLYSVLDEAGYQPERCSDGKSVLTTHIVENKDIIIETHLYSGFPLELPVHFLKNRSSYGEMAHVLWSKDNLGGICIGSKEAFHLNYDIPENIVIDTLKKAINIVSQAMVNKEYNTSELIREFTATWNLNVDADEHRVITIAEPQESPVPLSIKCYKPNPKTYLDRSYIAIDSKHNINERHRLLDSAAERQDKGKGILVPIKILNTPPLPHSDIKKWWLTLLTQQPIALQKCLGNLSRHTRAKEIFIICHIVTEHGPTWFALKGTSIDKQKHRAPLTESSMTDWTLIPIIIDSVISKESLLPRGGANVNLNNANVCIVGCGSVGSYIADMLASSGIGKLTLVDNDTFRPENLHRHYLSSSYLGYSKVTSLKVALEQTYPFINVKDEIATLEKMLNDRHLQDFDVVVFATGNVTLERYANEYLRKLDNQPIGVFTWVEAYGIGGHAVATIPNQPGCLSCIYRDEDTNETNLYPNTSFIEKGQNILTSHAGCGSEYIAYSNIDATQTAAIASRLTLRALTGKLNAGVSVSWRGADDLAKNHGIKLSERYYKENRINEEIPLIRGCCDVCC